MVEPQSDRLDAVFHALSDPIRRSILRDVARKEKTVSRIARPYEVSLAAVSKHLKVLETADLIRRERRGSFQVIRLNASALKSAQRWLSFYERFWQSRLDALQTMLEGENDE
jgi:DNA-binding transcriptional ArsR family regulator